MGDGWKPELIMFGWLHVCFHGALADGVDGLGCIFRSRGCLRVAISIDVLDPCANSTATNNNANMKEKNRSASLWPKRSEETQE